MRLDLLVQSCATDAYRLLQRCLHECFECRELVHDTHRLALMNAMLHDIEGQIILGDTLSNIGKSMNGYHLVLPNEAVICGLTPEKACNFKEFAA